MTFKQIIFSCCFVVVLISCKKEYSVENVQEPKTNPQSTSNTEVITTGFSIDNNDMERAVYWKDSNFFYVEPGAKDYTDASSAVMWNNNLVLSGEFWVGPYTYACYWINGQRHILSTNSSDDHTVLDSKIFNNALYILEKDDDGGAVIHKINNINGGAKAINLNMYTPLNICPSSLVDVTNIGIDNNKLIVFGSYRNSINNNRPCLWEIDASDKVAHIIIPENNNTNFRVFAGDCSNGITYIVGEISPGGIPPNQYIIWNRAGKYTYISTAKSTSSLAGFWRRLQCKIDAMGNAYVMHTLPNPFNADVYMIKPQKQIVHQSNFLNGSYAFGMDILGEEYAFGTGYISTLTSGNIYNKYCGAIEKNDQTILLKTPSNTRLISLREMRIFPK